MQSRKLSITHMKILLSVFILFTAGCGDNQKGERCRSAEEAQMKCQIDYAEKYHYYVIPDRIKELCLSYYPGPGCYLDLHSRH